jgi:hypothetical protein
MAGVTRNIIIGAASIFISKLDSTDSAWTESYQDGLDPFVTADPGVSLLEQTGASDALDTTPSGKWRDIGFTSEGLEVMYEPTFGEVEVDQQLDVAKLFKQSQRVMLNTTFTEATLTNLLVVFGLKGEFLQNNVDGDPESQMLLNVGALSEEPTERQLVAVGRAPRGIPGTSGNEERERVYYTRRVLSVESSTHALRRNEATVFPVTFRLLSDSRYSSGTYGKIVDRVI